MRIYFSANTILILLVLCLPADANAQDEPFHGGHGDGYSVLTLAGGTNSLSNGSDGDGYTSALLADATLSISLGSFGDGYTQALLTDETVSISLGSFGDGYTKALMTDESLSVSTGAFGDGYARADYIKIYWTGNIGTAWLNANNWSSLTIPENDDEIIIPAGRPNYPLLGAQLLSIGDPDITTGFRCAQLWVLEGASFSGKLNTTLANQSLLRIDGTFIWQNPSPASFLNHLGGMVRIGGGGVLMTSL